MHFIYYMSIIPNTNYVNTYVNFDWTKKKKTRLKEKKCQAKDWEKIIENYISDELVSQLK